MNLRPIKILTLVSGSALTFYYLKDSKSAFYSRVAMPLIHAFLDAEEAHKLAIYMIKNGLVPSNDNSFPRLNTKIWGFSLDNPLGLAAGFDKNAESINGNLDIGFGAVEVGSITPIAQAGNPLPRFFRLPQYEVYSPDK